MKTKQKSIDVATLRNWLEEEKPVVVIDVRPQEQRAEWSIPNSTHIDAYEKLKQRQSDALDGIDLPKNVPVVTVCSAGKTSEIAAQFLENKGYEVYSLKGGMKAWSLSWNVASLKEADLIILQIRRTGKGCLSYLVASGNEAVVIDASLDIEVYKDLVKKNGWKIKYVMDTHIHADHLSRSPELAKDTGALLFMPDQNKLEYSFNKITDGNILAFGSSQLKAIHTPGHTMDSTTYYINEKYLITGDTLFVDGVGRPDLKADVEQASFRASILYDSIQQLMQFNKEVIVLPGHISQPIPFDKIIIGAALEEIKKKVSSIALSKAEFVKQILAKLPATPPNYLTVTEINLTGNVQDVNVIELEAGANRCAIS